MVFVAASVILLEALKSRYELNARYLRYRSLTPVMGTYEPQNTGCTQRVSSMVDLTPIVLYPLTSTLAGTSLFMAIVVEQLVRTRAIAITRISKVDLILFMVAPTLIGLFPEV